ncbi:MAG: hypothetical protein ABSH38_14455 [Verrucomicrobiota bacterium]|jgi:hypothetical protein
MSLRSLIFHNFWLKTFSVVLATVIWFFIHDGIRHDNVPTQLSINHLLAQEYIRVPVTVQTNIGETRVFRVTPSEVVVTAVGEQTALLGTKQDIKAYLNLRDFHSKEPVTEELRVDAPTNINVLEINPPVVTVQQVSP